MLIQFGLQTRTLRIAEQSNAQRSWTERSSILLTLSDSSGVTALGEATPLTGYGPDTFAEALAALRSVSAQDLGAALSSRDLGVTLVALSELVPAPCASARFALETAALHSFAAQQQRTRLDLLSALLGGAVHEPSSSNTAPAQLLNLREDWLAALRDFRRQGSRCFKVKIGVSSDERDALRSLREQLRADEQLRLDANGNLPTALSSSFLKDLAVQFVEEPLPELGEPRTLGFPVALDESLHRAPEAALRWIEAGVAAAIVVKPMCLGLATTLDWCRLARSHHIPIVVSHCFDGAVAHRIYTALARAVASNGIAPGLGQQPASALWHEEAQNIDVRI